MQMKKWRIACFCMLLLCVMNAAWAEEIAPQEEGQALKRVESYQFSIAALSVPYGTRIGDCALDAAGSTLTVDGETVAAHSLGSFSWRDANAVPAVGTHVFSAYFTPNQPLEGASFEDVQVSVTVQKARPAVSQMPKASAIVYGQSLHQSVLSGGVMVNPVNASLGPVQGEFAWEIRDLMPSVGLQEAVVVFTPVINDAERYETVYLTVPVEVQKCAVQLADAPRAARALTYGEKLEAAGLTGGAVQTADGQVVSGVFSWQNGEQVLPAGVHQVNGIFVPYDAAHVEELAFQISVQVNPAPLQLMADPVTLTYGQRLEEMELTGRALREDGMEIAGSWHFSDGALMPEVAQSGLAVQVAFVPEDQANYLPGTAECTVQVLPRPVTVYGGDNWKYAGMQDGDMVYTVDGLPLGETLLGKPSRESGEAVGVYALSFSSLSLPDHLQHNYVLLTSESVYEIRAYDLPVPAVTLSSEEEAENGWYRDPLMLTAPEGYVLSLQADGPYAVQVSAPESASGADCYLRVQGGVYDGALCGSLHVDYRLDMQAPDIRRGGLAGNALTLVYSDEGSGLMQAYDAHRGNTEKFAQGLMQAECTYYIREAGEYVFVVYDQAGNTSSLSLRFEDQDGDGLSDVYELQNGTDPEKADTDGDGVKDADARRIRMMLDQEELDLSAGALLGSLLKGEEAACAIPEAGVGALVRDESVQAAGAPETLSGVMRLGCDAAVGMQDHLLWRHDGGTTQALQLAPLTGKMTLAPHTPEGVMLYGHFADGACAEDLRLVCWQTGFVYTVQGSTGCTRFDIAPDGSVMAWYRAGAVTLLRLADGQAMGVFDMDTENLFQFDGADRLLTDAGVLEYTQDAWHAEEMPVWQGAAYLDQPVMGECVMLLTDGEDRDLIALDGQGALEKGQVMLSVQGAHIHLVQDESMQEALEKLLQMDRSDSGIRAVDAGHMTK